VATLGILAPFASGACQGWPLCKGELLPPAGGEALVAWIHRVLAMVLVGVLLALVREARGQPPASVLAGAALVAVLAGVAVGAGLALGRTDPGWRAAHLGLGLGSVGVLAAVVVAAFAAGPRAVPASRAAAPAALWAVHLGLLAVGRAGEAAALAFLAGLGLAVTHRGLPELRATAGAVSVLAAFQLLTRWLGGGLAPTHAVAGVGTSGGLATFAALSWLHPGRPLQRPSPPGFGSLLAAYCQLAKPRVVLLLLVTTVCAMFAAGGLQTPAWIVAATVVGGALCAGGANALNCVVDRDVDAVMRRTRGRPLVVGRLLPAPALAYGVLLGLVAFGLLAALVNLLAATLAALGYLFYVLVYSVWLKRHTAQNIVIGGAAGAVPPLVGWAAVTDRLDLLALLLFVVVFLWTPPHFWALALVRRDDYARAGIPMLPVVQGDERTRRGILLYTALLVAFTLAMAALGRTGLLYSVGAATLGALFLRSAWRLYRERTVAAAWSLFKFSNAYLALLFATLVADRLLFGGA